MKKVAILFLLSLSLCLSKPTETDQQVAPVPKSNEIVLIPENGNNTEVALPIPTTPKENIQLTSANVTKLTSETPNKRTESTQATTQQTEVKQNASKPSDSNNNTTEKKDEKTTIENVTPPKGAQSKVSTENDVKNDTKTDTKPKNDPIPKSDVTPKTNVTTEAPKSETDKPPLQARGFDGPSFMGGIILTLGLLAIGFMGFKYYKNQTERNYHTL